MRFSIISFLLMALIAGPSVAQTGDCMQSGVGGQIAEGRIAIGRFKDAADRPETAYILLLPTATCLSASDPEERVESTTKIHIFSSADPVHQSLQRLVGKTVLVRGEPLPAHTVHHHAPIIMNITEVGQQ